MGVISNLITALTPAGLPIAPRKYTGTESTYLTYTYVTFPRFFANDEHQAERYTIMVHLFAPAELNTTALRAQISALLVANEFDPPSTVDASDDTGNQHIVFETGALV